MKKNQYISNLVILAIFIGVFACRKIVEPIQLINQTQTDSVQAKKDSTKDSTPVHHDTVPVKHDSTKQTKVDTPAAQVPYPQTPPPASCSALPIYGDSIIYQQPSGSDYIARVVNSPGTGRYFSWPIGMVIDSVTGAINVTKSQTGMRYAIGFVKSGTTDTCLSQLIIGGAAYMDSVYVLNDHQEKALPYYDANPYLPPVCSGPGTSCTFDVTGSAAARKVVINNSSGEIDLKKTLNGTGLLGGAFGLLPLDGQTITVPVYYKLNDASNHALQHIDLTIAYYSSKSSIGSGLLGNLVNKLTNTLSLLLISKSYNPRPPLIIIVRRD